MSPQEREELTQLAAEVLFNAPPVQRISEYPTGSTVVLLTPEMVRLYRTIWAWGDAVKPSRSGKRPRRARITRVR